MRCAAVIFSYTGRRYLRHKTKNRSLTISYRPDGHRSASAVSGDQCTDRHFHDRYDKICDYQLAEQMQQGIESSSIVAFEAIICLSTTSLRLLDTIHGWS